MTQTTFRPSRRQVVAGLTGAIATPWFWTPSRAAQSLVIADSGGVYTTALTEALYKPFEKETGIEIVPVARRNNPAAEFKAQVETQNYTWDACGVMQFDEIALLNEAGYLDSIDLSGDDISAIPADMKTDYFLADSVVSFVMAYRTDIFKKKLESFADMWDVGGLPGRRGMRRVARDTIEVALRADGVAPGPDIYEVLSAPDGWDRAFRKLDELKAEVKVWYDSATQSVTLLQNGEVDVLPAFNARAQVAIDSGTPLEIVWNDGFYSKVGWCIPRGNPKADLARQFIKYCARADRQAAWTEWLTNGPSNPDAYEHIDDSKARTLPTFAENFAQQAPLDGVFWGKNKAMAQQRFNEWLLQR